MPTTRSNTAATTAAAAQDAADWARATAACRAHGTGPLPFIIPFSIRMGSPQFVAAFVAGWLSYADEQENNQ
tara:strand:- start:435 stop:650 length:216 start_codon:yes stop_codon:yes gene_type:complete